jgi:hypothetical protein
MATVAHLQCVIAVHGKRSKASDNVFIVICEYRINTQIRPIVVAAKRIKLSIDRRNHMVSCLFRL